MTLLRTLDASLNYPQRDYAYMRVPSAWTHWTYRGVAYQWRDRGLFARESNGAQWRFDPYRDEWIRVVEAAA